MEDPLRNIEPVQLGVKQMCQASVELPSITDDTGCGSKRCSLSVMVLGDPANTVLQPSMHDVMKACTMYDVRTHVGLLVVHKRQRKQH